MKCYEIGWIDGAGLARTFTAKCNEPADAISRLKSQEGNDIQIVYMRSARLRA